MKAAQAISAPYTLNDHEARSQDAYAQSKYRITLRWLTPYLRPGSRLLNIGCGGGYFHEMVPKDVAITGCEPDAAAFALAVKHNPDASRIRLLNQGLFDLDTSQKADTLVMHDVLEHIEDEEGAVRTLAALVTPDARLVVSVPAGPWLFGFHDTQLGHYRRYTRASLRRALEPHFRIERMRTFGFSFIPLVLWFSVLAKKSYPAQPTGRPNSLLSRLFRSLCRLEELLPLPWGTSLICELTPRQGASA